MWLDMVNDVLHTMLHQIVPDNMYDMLGEMLLDI